MSIIARRDAGTGVQRVVRSLLGQLQESPPPGHEVKPVRATRWRRYRTVSPAGAIAVRPGDLFLGLDLSGPVLPRHVKQLAGWRAAGAKVVVLIHDLLPAQHPGWFTPRAVRHYANWIRAVAGYADVALCTSRTGARAFEAWLEQHHPGRGPAVSWFHLGADVADNLGATGKRPDFDALVARLAAAPAVLMVGTLEPRKGHAAALDAFEALWHEGSRAQLVIAGGRGWKVEDLARRLRMHPEAGRRLHWLEKATDEELCLLYGACAGFLMASEAEGFGLPLVEAARFGKPVLARDLPVFRELAGDGARYFAGAAELPAALAAWLKEIEAGTAPSGIRTLTWKESAVALIAALKLAP